MITRADKTRIDEYAKAVAEGNYDKPSDKTVLAMSKLLDEATQRVYLGIDKDLKESKKFKKAIATLNAAPRTCGGYKEKNAILESYTPFEQTAAVVYWVKDKKMRKIHTLTLSTDEGIVPVCIKPPKDSSASPMTTILGSTRGSLKAPAYSSWADSDPKGTTEQVFIEPLNGLEMHRQPGCLGALVLKASGYQAGVLEHDMRYKIWDAKGSQMAKEASVELKGQQTTPVKRIKEQSAGYNLTSMIESKSIRGKNILPQLNFEDYSEKEYRDYDSAFLSPKSIVKTFPGVLKGNTEELDAAMSKLFLTRVGNSSIPKIKKAVIDNLFEEE